jgi:subtilisin-like proprotein convertase family protein
MGDMRIGLDTPEGDEIIRGERVLRRRRLADAAFAVECDLA